MHLVRKRAFARAGLVGNPSDGYHGRTISISVRNFWAEVVLYEWDSVDIVLQEDDRASFRSVKDLARDVRLHGYYGGIRLVKATIKRFVEYCEARRITLHDRNFSIRYETTIPRQVGLAGSSAIIVATLRCLMEFYDVTIPLAAQPTFVLSVEKEELSIAAGLQDRVIQVHEGLTSRSTRRSCRRYTSRTTMRSASRPRCSTTTSAGASTAASRKWSRPCVASRAWPRRRGRRSWSGTWPGWAPS